MKTAIDERELAQINAFQFRMDMVPAHRAIQRQLVGRRPSHRKISRKPGVTGIPQTRDRPTVPEVEVARLLRRREVEGAVTHTLDFNITV